VKDPERRYQMWLRVYPKSYRTVRGDEILSTLLDSTDRGRPATRDLLFIVAHAIRLRINLFVRGRGRRHLPQPVRFVTWILVGLAASNWLNAILDHGYPKAPNPGPSSIAVGFIFLGLNLLLQARRWLAFVLVIGTFVAFIASTVLHSRPAYGGLILASPYVLFVLLLIFGWKRYMTAIANDRLRSGRSGDLIPTKR
jgi:hypothetical protein